MTEEKNSSQKEEQAKNSGWKKINKKFVLLSFFFLFIGFISGYQVSGMNNQAGTRQPRANQVENSDDQNNNTMENGRPDQRGLPSDRSNGEESDAIGGATESEEDQLESGSTTNQSNNTSATEDVI
ncbi:MAG: hypothetical protein ACRCTN_04525 [Carnobacterium maltaromaticum]